MVWIVRHPSGEKVLSLNTRGASSGLVSACEKASIPTMRPIRDGSTELGRGSSAKSPVKNSIRSTLP